MNRRYTPLDMCLDSSINPSREYRIVFDSTGDVLTLPGIELIRDGIPLRLETVGQSELLLFEAK